MAARKPAKVAAPVKQKLRKRHGPKRKLFHEYTSTARLAMARGGVLSKYNDFESFCLALAARGIREKVTDMKFRWKKFCELPDLKARREYFKTLTK